MKKKNASRPLAPSTSPVPIVANILSLQPQGRSQSTQAHPPRSTSQLNASGPTKPVTRPSLGPRSADAIVRVIIVIWECRLYLRAVPWRKQDPDVVGGRGVDVLGRHHVVVQAVAVRSVVVVVDAIRDSDGQVEDGVVVFIVEAEVLPDRDLGAVLVRNRAPVSAGEVIPVDSRCKRLGHYPRRRAGRHRRDSPATSSRCA